MFGIERFEVNNAEDNHYNIIHDSGLMRRLSLVQRGKSLSFPSRNLEHVERNYSRYPLLRLNAGVEGIPFSLRCLNTMTELDYLKDLVQKHRFLPALALDGFPFFDSQNISFALISGENKEGNIEDFVLGIYSLNKDNDALDAVIQEYVQGKVVDELNCTLAYMFGLNAKELQGSVMLTYSNRAHVSPSKLKACADIIF